MFPYSADHEQDWQPYPVDPYSAESADHTSIYTITRYVHTTDGCIHKDTMLAVFVLYQHQISN